MKNLFFVLSFLFVFCSCSDDNNWDERSHPSSEKEQEIIALFNDSTSLLPSPSFMDSTNNNTKISPDIRPESKTRGYVFWSREMKEYTPSGGVTKPFSDGKYSFSCAVPAVSGIVNYRFSFEAEGGYHRASIINNRIDLHITGATLGLQVENVKHRLTHFSNQRGILMSNGSIDFMASLKLEKYGLLRRRIYMPNVYALAATSSTDGTRRARQDYGTYY